MTIPLPENEACTLFPFAQVDERVWITGLQMAKEFNGKVGRREGKDEGKEAVWGDAVHVNATVLRV